MAQQFFSKMLLVWTAYTLSLTQNLTSATILEFYPLESYVASLQSPKNYVPSEILLNS